MYIYIYIYWNKQHVVAAGLVSEFPTETSEFPTNLPTHIGLVERLVTSCGS